MPTILEAAHQVATAGVPVLCIDTCVLLDIIRTPLRKTPGCIQGAVELAELQAQSHCRIVASSMIQDEWGSRIQTVVSELERHLETKMPLPFMKRVTWSRFPYRSANRRTRLRAWSPNFVILQPSCWRTLSI
jgi:hypothetical protein